jgi:hypothetical protein
MIVDRGAGALKDEAFSGFFDNSIAGPRSDTSSQIMARSSPIA